jgi:hypothetical protein
MKRRALQLLPQLCLVHGIEPFAPQMRQVAIVMRFRHASHGVEPMNLNRDTKNRAEMCGDGLQGGQPVSSGYAEFDERDAPESQDVGQVQGLHRSPHVVRAPQTAHLDHLPEKRVRVLVHERGRAAVRLLWLLRQPSADTPERRSY